MKILLTGANGFVGARIRAAAPLFVRRLYAGRKKRISTASSTPCSRTPSFTPRQSRTSVRVPKTRKDPTTRTFWCRSIWPKPQTARSSCWFSSDQVYSGAKGDKPFTEDDVATANLYAEEKLEMENRVLAIDPNAVMLRATWMYDMPWIRRAEPAQPRHEFLNAAITQKPLALSKEEFRGVTYVREVARARPCRL